MTNREYIDQLTVYIKSFFDKEKETKGFVESKFFQSDELKQNVNDILNKMVDLGVFPEINNEKFDELYSRAVKEAKHASILGMNPSVGLSSEETEKDLWLTKDKIKELKKRLTY